VLDAKDHVLDVGTQIAHGYDATIVSGEVTWQDGEHTGALPGRLVRGGRA
jgi:N-acyl-D-aspartate/D-glutamate deacylase